MADLYPSLFAPLNHGRLRFKNRIVHASMSTRMTLEQRATARQIQYSANRARGGCAAIVTEPLNVARNQTQSHKVRVWDDHALDSLKQWAEAVESHDCRLLGQVQDPGRGRHERGRNPSAFGPSALPDDLSWTVPRALSVDEIRIMIEDFANSAARLERCGWSGVEISAGHGHLFHQFLSPLSNDRTDDYGGTPENRARFLLETIAAIRASCSNQLLLALKLPGDDGMPGGIGPEAAAEITQRVADPAVIDYICYTWGTHSHTLDLHIPDMHFPRATFVSITRALQRSARGIPVMAVGLITDPAEANGIIERGDAMLVGLGRPLVTDPAFPNKARAG
ncbi:MAG TPA: NADH:flavin oxidoreductase, partial [Steroidobacteraceae bacterium]|nr:NADH:flavin oxidoreductase [Steroidobacteraceae bacterium]